MTDQEYFDRFESIMKNASEVKLVRSYHYGDPRIFLIAGVPGKMLPEFVYNISDEA